MTGKPLEVEPAPARPPATPAPEARERLLAGLPLIQRRMRLAGVETGVLEGGSGPPLVLLHGPGGHAANWMRVVGDLVATHRVIVPDLPGQGTSELDGPPLGAAEVLAWLGELIERTCAAPPVIVGNTLGGAIAARFAIAHPDRLGALVLVDALGLTAFAPAPAFAAALDDFVTQPSERTHDLLWRQCAHDLDGLRAQMDARWEPFAAYNIDRARTAGVLAALGSLMEQFGTPAIPPADLARITVPTTLIWGRHDRATPLAVAEEAAARHRWPLHVIDGAADEPPLERPAAFLRALRAALGTTTADALAASGFGGEIVDPDHPRYDELRAVFNGMIDRRPALIARCADAHDVAAAVRFATREGLPVSVFGGGHNVTGNAVCDGGVTIDLRPIKKIEIDPERRVCRAGAGLTWGELDAATQEHGLAVTGGRMSTTGLGGLVVGGGSGWIERKHGYSVDNLLSAEIVTADGRIVTASEDEHPDLFWGTRGGGGNLGVATRFELRLHPVGPTLLAGMLLYPAAVAPAVLRNFRDVMADAPDEVGAGVALLTAPPADFVPEPVRGQPVVGVIACYVGPVEEGEAALAPLREFGPPALDLVQPMPYVALQRLIDDGYPAGMRNYWTGDFLTGLPDEAIAVLCRFHLSKPSPLTQILTLPGGGAGARVPDGTMAITERGAPFNLHITSLWADPADDEANIAWTREFKAAMKPFTTGRVYVNFIGDEGEEGVIASFGREGYARMQALKDRYDPGNLFRSNQNVRPSGP
jgi:FAD/FMN-containing dehydrogenase/pimeloyl-ACP methyl ester carboxylesterase